MYYKPDFQNGVRAFNYGVVNTISTLFRVENIICASAIAANFALFQPRVYSPQF
jgi:hypothetical protein